MYINYGKLVFSITYACPGRCAHCQIGSDQKKVKGAMDPDMAERALRSIAARHDIGEVMAFGGEPMLYPETVCRIMSVATELQIRGRYMITNGFVKADPNPDTAREAALRLADSGIRDVLLSVDAFHEVHIPFEPVFAFAEVLKGRGIGIRLHPAWIGGRDQGNEHNARTRAALAKFASLDLPITNGNVVNPSVDVGKRLGDHFAPPSSPEAFKDYRCGDGPYTNPLDDITELHFAPNGDMMVCHYPIGNFYRDDAADIAERYDPHAIEDMALLMEAGPYALYQRRLADGLHVDIDGIYTACDLCARACEAIKTI